MFIKAVKKDEELMAEMDSLLEDENHFHLWWLGQSGFLLQWKGKRVLIDPSSSPDHIEQHSPEADLQQS